MRGEWIGNGPKRRSAALTFILVGGTVFDHIRVTVCGLTVQYTAHTRFGGLAFVGV